MATLLVRIWVQNHYNIGVILGSPKDLAISSSTILAILGTPFDNVFCVFFENPTISGHPHVSYVVKEHRSGLRVRSLVE